MTNMVDYVRTCLTMVKPCVIGKIGTIKNATTAFVFFSVVLTNPRWWSTVSQQPRWRNKSRTVIRIAVAFNVVLHWSKLLSSPLQEWSRAGGVLGREWSDLTCCCWRFLGALSKGMLKLRWTHVCEKSFWALCVLRLFHGMLWYDMLCACMSHDVL